MVLESLSFTKTLYAFDFDGTLAKIVPKPSDAHLTKTTEKLLFELSQLVPVAIISGRSIQDLKKRVRFQAQFLVGNHGLEGLTEGSGTLAGAQKICVSWNKSLKRQNFESGIELENKNYSIALHYRQSRNKTLAKIQIHSAIEKLNPPPRLVTGKFVFNLLPPGSAHKGAAMLDLMRKSETKHAFYIGDDDTDEDIFGIPYKSGQLMTARVGKKKSSQAKYYIGRQSEINQLLRILINFHRPPVGKKKKKFTS